MRLDRRVTSADVERAAVQPPELIRDIPFRRTIDRPLPRVLVPNLGARYSGVTSVIRATTPHLQRRLDADLVGRPAGELQPRFGTLGAMARGFAPPDGAPFRIWHARRNIEMAWGLVMRDLLRQPVRLVFTSAAQRRHTRYTDWLIARMDAVIATTAGAAAVLHRPSVLIPHGIDCEVYRPAPDRAAAWAATGLPGRSGIGVFGRVRHQKGTDLFVEALIRLLPSHPDVTGVVIGLTKSTEAAFLADLQRRVQAAGLADRLLFLGEQPAGRLPDLLRAVSVCVAPQRNEGFGLVPLEAAASATPVVAARSGAAAEIVDDGETGLLVEPGDLDALTDAVGRLLDDAALRTRMGEAARRKAVERFDIGHEVDGYVAIYRALWGSNAE